MATRAKTDPAPPASVAPRLYPTRLTLAVTTEWGSTIDHAYTRETLEKLLRGEIPMVRIPDGNHPQGHARYVGFQSIAQVDIIGDWDDPAT